MRVIAGDYRGRRLRGLKGDATRPTTDRVKESLMSAIVSVRGSFDGAVVLDAFAGTGSLGIEALSRGATYVTFCDRSSEAQSVIRANVEQLSLDPSRFRIARGDVFRNVDKLSRMEYDLVFLDPPYAYSPQEVFSLLEALDGRGALSCDALVCYEHAKKNKSGVVDGLDALEWTTVSLKDYGDTSVLMARKDAQ